MAAAVAVASPEVAFPGQEAIHLQVGLPRILEAITMITNHIEGRHEREIHEEEFETLYRISIAMITQEPPYNYSSQLYNKYCESIKEYIISEALPPLMVKHDEFFLTELVQRWSNHKVMVNCLSYLFLSLELSFIPREGLAPLKTTGLACFRDMICQEVGVKRKINAALIALIGKQHKGKQMDMSLLRTILDIFVEFGLDCYYFEDFLIKWNSDDSVNVENVPLHQFSKQLIEDEYSKCSALFRDKKVEDLHKMYTLFSKISGGLKPIIDMFKAHLTDHISDLVRQAENSASNKEVFLQKIVELHDTSAAYVMECFQGHRLFRKALKDGVCCSSTPESFAAICENIVKKGGSANLSNEAMKYAFEKAARALVYIGNKNLFAKSYRNELARELLSFNLRHKLLPSLKEKHGENMLKELVEWWSNHEDKVKVVVMQLDKYISEYMYIESGTSLEDVALTCFRQLIYQGIKGQIKDSVIYLIDGERDGQYIDMALLKDVIAIFLNVEPDKDCYGDDFEVFLLNGTRDYYSVKIQSWMVAYSCSDYMVKVEKCLKQEKERCAHYLHATSEHKLLEEVRSVLLTQYLNVLLRDEKIADLYMIYTYILSSAICGALEPNVDMFKKHVVNEGTTLVKQAENSITNKKLEMDMAGMRLLVGILNALHDKYASVMECFQGHILFHGVVEGAFDAICKNSVSCSSSAELLSTFMDNILNKDCSENLSDEDIKDALDKVLRLLAYIRNKEPFALSYWDNLGRRLILNENSNDEHVRNLLTKLEPQLGSQFTSRMKRMWTDIIVARDHQTEFKEFVNAHPELNPGIVLDVTVLSKGPCYKTCANPELKPGIDLAISAVRTGVEPSFEATILPPEIVKSSEVFKTFYLRKCEGVPEEITMGKKLIWLPSLLTCTIDAKFDAENIELIVTRSQALLLQLFNESDRLCSSEIVTQLELSRDDVACLLYSLSCGEYKILKKDPTNTTISTNDIFEFNSKFTNGGATIKIPLPPVDLKMKVVNEVYSNYEPA